jgi:Rap1a immunity proteins
MAGARRSLPGCFGGTTAKSRRSFVGIPNGSRRPIADGSGGEGRSLIWHGGWSGMSWTLLNEGDSLRRGVPIRGHCDLLARRSDSSEIPRLEPNATAIWPGHTAKYRPRRQEQLTTEQARYVLMRYLEQHPETRHQPAAVLATAALAGAFPCKP